MSNVVISMITATLYLSAEIFYDWGDISTGK